MAAKDEISLRQLAKGLGVSHSFLSQVRNGKRPMPEHLRERVEALGAYHLLTTSPLNDASSDTDIHVAPALHAGSHWFESSTAHHSATK